MYTRSKFMNHPQSRSLNWFEDGRFLSHETVSDILRDILQLLGKKRETNPSATVPTLSLFQFTLQNAGRYNSRILVDNEGALRGGVVKLDFDVDADPEAANAQLQLSKQESDFTFSTGENPVGT